MQIKISRIEILPVEPRNGLLALCSFVINNAFYVGDVAIYSRLNGSGYRLSYPFKKIGDTKISMVHPINREATSEVERQVINKYLELITKITQDRQNG